NRFVNGWNAALTRMRSECRKLQELSLRIFPDWQVITRPDWQPADEPPPGVRIGDYQVILRGMGGVPAHDQRPIPEDATFLLPAALPFPAAPALVLKAGGGGLTDAVATLTVGMLRLLTQLPPGRLRFTIIDPVGLGENFAAFMHLADYDDALVGSRIWTEPDHIEQRLADMAAHMENVIQKYLRNQFATIEEYNAHAGEVAEPYRVLVVANFPVNFSVDAARRLVSILQSGPRCGVYTLVSIDSKQTLPQGFNLQDLQQPGVN